MNDEQKAEARAVEDLKEGFLSLWVIAGKLADERGYRIGSAARREFLEEIDRAAMAGAFDVFSRKVRAPIEKPQSINGEVHAFWREVWVWSMRDESQEPREKKRAIVIDRNLHVWPSIAEDMRNRRGLIAAARRGGGYWDEHAALVWACNNNRMTNRE